MTSAQVRVDGLESIFAKLESIPIELRGGVMIAAMKKVGVEVAKRGTELVQQPGKKGYTKRVGRVRPTKKMLRDTIGSIVKEYSGSKFSGLVMVAGPQAPAGAHGWWVEHGHRLARGGSLVRLKKNGKVGSTPNAKGIKGGGKEVGHTEKFPFMAPALQDTESKFSAIVADGMKKALEKISK